jgi:hypothetical protein
MESSVFINSGFSKGKRETIKQKQLPVCKPKVAIFYAGIKFVF